MPVGVELAKADHPWWGPSWNTGDLAYSMINLDGPSGQAAITRYYDVFAGRYYGGGLRGGQVDLPNPDTARNNADIEVSFWLKGTSTGNRGQVGFSLLGFDSSSGSGELTGGEYYLVPIAPAEWTEVTFSLDEAQGGVPDHATSEIGGIDWSITDKVQVFFWLRNEQEAGWPTDEDENQSWSISVADISIVEEGGTSPTWAGLPVIDGWVEMENGLGWLHVESAPWLFSYALGSYVFIDEAMVNPEGSCWAFFPKNN